MPNVTISADEEILQRARVEAARRNISLSRFMSEIFKEKFAEKDAYELAMQDFFSREPYLDPAPREDGRCWPARHELYDRKTIE